jgi:acyl dehydratase
LAVRPDLDAATSAVPTHTLPADRDARYFEDYRPGLTVEGGPLTISEHEIIAFARQFDPQPFHLDAQAASGTPAGGLIASGWHTASVMMRLLVEHFLPLTAGLASPGVDELRWLAPVRPGDALSLHVTVTESRRSRSKPDRGLVHTAIALSNQRAEPVLTLKAMTLMRCRAPEAA